MGTSLYIRATPRQGKRATSLFAGDEIITTADSEKALVRYFRGGPFQSVIRESDLTPGAVAYIEEGDFFVVLVLTSTDAHFAEAKRVFKAVVGSYRKTGSNRR